MQTHTIIVSENGNAITTRPVALASNAAARRVAKARSAQIGSDYLVEVFGASNQILGMYRGGM